MLADGLYKNIDVDLAKNTVFTMMRDQSIVRSKSYRQHYRGQYLYYQKLRPTVCMYKLRDRDAGYDILNDQEIKFEPFEQKIVPLGISVEIVRGNVGVLYFTSSFSKTHKFVLSAGVIDSGYTGELKANVISLSPEVQFWKPNNRIIQIVISRIFDCEPRCVEGGLYEKTSRGFR